MTHSLRILRRIAFWTFVGSISLILWSGATYQGDALLFGTFCFLGLATYLATESFGPPSRRFTTEEIFLVRALFVFAATGLVFVGISYVRSLFGGLAAAA